MDRNRVILGVVLALVLLAAVKIPAIPVETQASGSLHVEGHGESFTETELAYSRRDPAGGVTVDSSDDGETQSPGYSALIDPRRLEYRVPLAHEIRGVDAALGRDGETVATTVTVHNGGNRSGRFAVNYTYRRNGEVVATGRADPREIPTNGTAAFTHRIERPGTLEGWTVNATVDPATRTINASSPPDTDAANVTVAVYEVAVAHEVRAIDANLTDNGRRLRTTVVLANTDTVDGTFTVQYRYATGGNVTTETVTREVPAGDAETITSTVPYAPDAERYSIDVVVEPPTKLVATSERGSVEPAVETVERTTTVTHETRVSLLGYLLRVL